MTYHPPVPLLSTELHGFGDQPLPQLTKLSISRIKLEKPVMDFKSSTDAINAISGHLRSIYRAYAGAQFRLAFFRDNGRKQFLTGHVIFKEKHVRSRDAADYGMLHFVEHWCRDQWDAVDLLSKLLSGQAEIEGQRIENTFSRSDFDQRTYPTGPELWTGWELRSRRDRDATWKEIYVPQGHLTGRGLNPYLGPDHAINDWIFGLQSYNPVSADVPNKDTIVTILPDSRGRILSAEWQPGKLCLEVEINVPPDQVELQVLHIESRNKFQSLPLDAREIEVRVPEDALSLSIFLLDHSGKCISHISLDEHHRTFGKANPDSGRPVYGRTVLDGDEIDLADVDASDLQNGGLLELRRGNSDRRFMQAAIEEAWKSKAEDERSHPKVGAVVVKDGRILAKAHRGEFAGCHAEYIALEKKLAHHSVAGATVYTTLEPCTTRNHPKIPCASRLVERRVARVVIGMLDPNPDITGRGQRALRKARIATELFPHDLMDEIEELNREFTRSYESQGQPAAAAPKSPINVNISTAKFRVFDINGIHTGVNIKLRLEVEYTGPKTTFSVHEVDVSEITLTDSATAFFSGSADKVGPHVPVDPGYTGSIVCSISLTATQPIDNVLSQICGFVTFKETHTGALPRIGFTAIREKETGDDVERLSAPDSAASAKLTSIPTQRPRLRVRRLELKVGSPIVQPEGEIANVGETDATITESHLQILCGASQSEAIMQFNDRAPNNPFTQREIKAGDSIKIPKLEFTDEMKWTKLKYEGGGTTIHLYAIGWIRYRGNGKTSNRTGILRRHDPRTGLFCAEKDAPADYEYED